MKNTRLEVPAARADLLAAIVPHVPFDGWSEPAFRAAVTDLEMDMGLARVICPRGAVDLAVEYHRAGDELMLSALDDAELDGMKFREKVAAAVRFRLEEADPELVRRGASVFALPANMATGAALIWGTADAIWRALGDESRDFNWYSKRLTLSGVYSATVLFWVGDTSDGHAATWEFLDRRIADVMQFEKVKGAVTTNPLIKRLLEGVRAPAREPMPGREGL
ncbi:COQ9 family protein [Phaeovulum sp.]|uniref:COQ9 family protein n=1 Tax=Phaeovulum sp. TaxID=2934796 RepID=UPI0039E66E0F